MKIEFVVGKMQKNLREGKIQEYVDGLVEKDKRRSRRRADKLGKLLFFLLMTQIKINYTRYSAGGGMYKIIYDETSFVKN